MTVAEGLHMRALVERGAFALRTDFVAPAGMVTAVVGPNGSGKSTLLRAVAGLESLRAGVLELDGRILDDAREVFVPAEHRPTGMVFQDYLLFPHLSVLDNVAFGLRARGSTTRAARVRAAGWLRQFGLDDVAERHPSQLSGGQAQRVALVRALATEPRALLLDEPLAALDAGTRADMRLELGRRLRAFDGVTLLVTHEPVEALILADHVVVLEAGQIVQAGTMAQVAARPASTYVAALVGVNLLRGRAREGSVDLVGGGRLVVAGGTAGEVLATIRPSAVTVHRNRPEGSARNVWQATVRSIEDIGDRIRVEFAGEPSLRVDLTASAMADLNLIPEMAAWLSVKATEIEVYPAPPVPQPRPDR